MGRRAKDRLERTVHKGSFWLARGFVFYPEIMKKISNKEPKWSD